MGATVNPMPTVLDDGLLELCRAVDVPTVGHYLETGFCDPAITRLSGSAPLVGRAVTVRLVAPDSAPLHHLASLVEPGDVVVIDCGGDRRHAPLGEVVAVALAARGAAGAVIDGVCTDVDALRRLDSTVFARGTSPLTTKLHGLDGGGINVPITCGGVTVHPGDVVLGDANGLLIAAPSLLAAVLPEARADDAAEPELIAALWRGERLGELTGASALITS